MPGIHYVEFKRHRDLERARLESLEGIGDDKGRRDQLDQYWLQVQHAMAVNVLWKRRIFIRDAFSADGARVMGNFFVKGVEVSPSVGRGLVLLQLTQALPNEPFTVSVRLETFIMCTS